jgi:hypothetical protein
MAMPMTDQLKVFIHDRKWQEADQLADHLLALMKSNPPVDTKPDALSLSERLPPKIQKIQAEVETWIQETGKRDKATGLRAIALMQQLKERLDAKNYEEAEKTADAILKMMGTSKQAATLEVPEEARKQMRHKIDSSFIVFRDKVQEELKLSEEQKEPLEMVLPDVMQFLQKLQDLKTEDQAKALKEYRQKARETLTAVLNETLDEGQLRRLHQLVRQREGLRNGEVWNMLQVTDEQRNQFITLIQQAQKETQSLMEELKKTSKLNEIQPKVIEVRDNLESKLEALLTETQKKQWQEMLGKPMDLADLFDL